MSCTGTEARLRESGELLLGADLAYPPFGFHPHGKDPVGLEVDVVRALAHDLKLELIVANRGSASLLPGLIAHRHDLAASALRDTEELRGEACVSAPYMDADLAILTPNPDPHDIGDAGGLDGRAVGVLDGSRAEEWVRSELRDSMLSVLPTTDDLLEALRARKVDAVVDEGVIARYSAKRSRAYAVAATIDTGESFVLAAAPDNGGLIANVNAALERFGARGGMAKLEEKWFGTTSQVGSPHDRSPSASPR
jgi:ABC-type amino acid transport substrate-binding protein